MNEILAQKNPSVGPYWRLWFFRLGSAALLAIVLFSIPSGVEADGAAARQKLSVATLSDLVEKAPDVRLTRWQEEILTARRDRIIRWPNPTASVDLSWKQSENSGLAFGLELGQEIPVWGQAASQKKWLKARSQIARRQKQKVKRNIMARGLLLSYRLFINQKVSQYQKKRRGYYKLMLKYLRSRPFISPKKKINKMMVETQYSRLLHGQKKTTIQSDKMRSELSEIFPSLSQTLAQTMAQKEWAFAFSMIQLKGKKPGPQKAPSSDKESDSTSAKGDSSQSKRHVKSPVNGSQEKELQIVLKGDVTYRILEAQKKSLRDKLKWQKALSYRNPAISGYYSQEPATPRDRYYGIGLSFPLPFKQKNRSEIAVTKKTIQKIEQQMERRKHILHRRLKGLRQRLARQREMFKIFPVSRIQKLASNMKRAIREFRRGTIDLMDFWSLENQVSDAVQKIYNLQNDYVHTLVQMWLLTGDRRLLEEIAHAD